MIKVGQGMDIYIQKLKLFVHPRILKIQIRAFVDCMFTKLDINIYPFFNSPNLGRQSQDLLGRGSGQHINFS